MLSIQHATGQRSGPTGDLDATTWENRLSPPLDTAMARLDSLMKPVDPISIFPQLASMGNINVPKGYVFLLVAFLGIGGLMIFIADSVYTYRRRKVSRSKKRDKADRVIRNFKTQSVFEAFVITLFDPLYFRHRRPKAERVLAAGVVHEGETGPDLEFEFNRKETRSRFAIKCQYYKHPAWGELQLFSAERWQALRNFEEEHGLPVYFVLGFGGTPDDPKELFLVPAKAISGHKIQTESLKPYSKSGMFYYNGNTERLQ